MALSANVAGQWMRELERPFRRLEQPLGAFGESRFREEDGEFLLSVELPGFERDDVAARWRDGDLYVVAERDGETFYRRFRFPKAVDGDGITATYEDGVLDVRLPVADDATLRGQRVPVED